MPHAVTSISGSTLSTTFTYDPNGNQLTGLGRNITWTSFNMPASITQGTHTIQFQYDADHQRVIQIAPDGTTTIYLNGFGASTELFAAGTAAARWTDYLSVGNARVGMRIANIAAATVSTRYFHTDHLGSVSVITDENGAVVERLSYDAWGKRRSPNGTDDPTGSITSQSPRGFTGEEQLDSVSLVHLNGRVYDPLVGRMISADPSVPDPMNAQAWNRYSYVGNDPLAFTDPSGFSWFSSFFHAIGNFFSGVAHFLTHNPIVRAIVQIGLTFALGATGIGLVVAAAAGAAITTGLSGGNLGQVLRAGLIAGATAFAFFEVGEFTGHTPGFGTPAYAANVAGHALVGCASSATSGGSCEAGALSGAVGSALSPLVSGPSGLFPDAKTDLSQRIGGTIIEATAGGLASVAGGGKFANGAVTGAFGYLFNAVAGTFNRATGLLTLTDQDTGEVFTGKFLSGGIGGGAIPDGTYSILERGRKDEFRLEAEDSTFGDDRVDGSGGRGLFRLHGPGITNGCIAACDAETWNALSKFINGTSTTDATVNHYFFGNSFFGGTFQRFRIPKGTETVKSFGTLTVQ